MYKSTLVNDWVERSMRIIAKKIKEFILKGTINNTVPFLRDGFFKIHKEQISKIN